MGIGSSLRQLVRKGKREIREEDLREGKFTERERREVFAEREDEAELREAVAVVLKLSHPFGVWRRTVGQRPKLGLPDTIADLVPTRFRPTSGSRRNNAVISWFCCWANA